MPIDCDTDSDDESRNLFFFLFFSSQIIIIIKMVFIVIEGNHDASIQQAVRLADLISETYDTDATILVPSTRYYDLHKKDMINYPKSLSLLHELDFNEQEKKVLKAIQDGSDVIICINYYYNQYSDRCEWREICMPDLVFYLSTDDYVDSKFNAFVHHHRLSYQIIHLVDDPTVPTLNLYGQILDKLKMTDKKNLKDIMEGTTV